MVFAEVDYGCDWTGFGQCVISKQQNEEVRFAKSLWGWLNLIVVPSALFIAGIFYSSIEKQREQKRTEDQLQETVLANYLDRISSLLLNNNLGDSEGNNSAHNIARGWTIMVLPRLNGHRKGVVLQFLHGANLLKK